MATVYRADDLKHGRKVALKVLKPELAAVVGAERFLAEIIGQSHAPSRDGGVIYVQGTNQSTASFLRVIPNWGEGAKRVADEANR